MDTSLNAYAKIEKIKNSMKSLDKIGIKWNTDKASIGRIEPNGLRSGGHNYLPVYSSFIQGLIKEITLI